MPRSRPTSHGRARARPDADLALKALVRLREALGGGWYEVAALIAGDKGFRGRLFGVLGSSDALGDHLVAEPEAWRVLVPPTLPNALDMRTSMLAAVDAHPDPSAGPDDLVYRAGVTGPGDHGAAPCLPRQHPGHRGA